MPPGLRISKVFSICKTNYAKKHNPVQNIALSIAKLSKNCNYKLLHNLQPFFDISVLTGLYI